MSVGHPDAELLCEVASALRWASHSGARHVALPEGAHEAPALSDSPSMPPKPEDDEVVTSAPGQRLRARPTIPIDRRERVSSEDLITKIRERLGDCTRCRLHQGRTQIVFGRGPADAALFIIGSGPGADEDTCGQPWQGEAGELLDRMLVAMGLSRSEVYLASGVMCRSPDSDRPDRQSLLACTPFLRSQLKAVAPRMVLVLGESVAQFLFKTDASVADLRGSWRDLVGFQTMVSHGPNRLLQEPALKRETWSDLKQVMTRLR